MPEYIARISYGKDSLKMLDVIKSRGLPLDRITTTDVWATDTISANLPPLEVFKAEMDQRIWDMYRIEVEHLCATNKDGSKRTYEQMFYHVPVRRSQNVNVERERASFGPEQFKASRCLGSLGVNQRSSEAQTVRSPNSFSAGDIKGFPLSTGVTWCQQLKINAKSAGVSSSNLSMVSKAQDRQRQNSTFLLSGGSLPAKTEM